MLNNKLITWIKNQKLINKIKTKRKSKIQLKQWNFQDNSIYHKKKIFFLIKPFVFKQNNKKWHQPLIIQKEEGILGIIKKKSFNTDYYLLQAKAEPGNINSIQISPTVQATKSNYLRKHGGKKTPYLNFFLKKNSNIKILSNVKLSEQGTRFLGKKNRNILLELKNKSFKPKGNFVWLTKKNIKFLLKKKNLLQMDTISIMSSIIKKNRLNKSLLSFVHLKSSLVNFKKKLKIQKNLTLFSNMVGWKVNNTTITDIKKKFFSIFFIEVKANRREVKNWDQPFISDHYNSLNCFIMSKINDTDHYLLQITQEAGFDAPKFTSTISEKNCLIKDLKNNRFMSYLKKKNFLLDAIYSDEGGRFYKNQTRNIICKLNSYNKLKITKKYIWASHNQIIDLINQNKITIEARNLFAIYNIDNIK